MKYQRLKQSDIIQEGDEYYTCGAWWTPIEPEFIGKRKGEVFGHYTRMRRRIADELPPKPFGMKDSDGKVSWGCIDRRMILKMRRRIADE